MPLGWLRWGQQNSGVLRVPQKRGCKLCNRTRRLGAAMESVLEKAQMPLKKAKLFCSAPRSHNHCGNNEFKQCK